MEEIWKDIPGFAKYQVSSLGQVRSCHRHWTMAHWRILKPGPSKKGYLAVVLYKNGTRHHHRVHRLVLEVFVGPCPPGLVACHNNDIKIDNQLTNLRWDTPESNYKDALRHNAWIGNSGSPHRLHKLTESNVREICKMRKSGIDTRIIAKKFGITRAYVYDIANRKSKGWVNDNDNTD